MALVVAVIRQSTGPVLLPLRVVATVYVDVARGVPLILIIFVLGYGLPALQLAGISDQSAAVYGVAALVLSYSAYVAEVYRAGINSVHRSQVAAARSLGLTQASSMRYVILPQAISNIIPPLLNDFISLQKDTAQVGLLGAIEANKAAEIYSYTVFNYSSYVVAAILFLILTIPLARFTDHLIRRDQARRLAGAASNGPNERVPAPGPGGSEALRIEGLRKSFGPHEVLRGVDLAVAPHEVICLIGASGSGKSTLLRCVNLLERIDAGTIWLDGQAITRPGVDENLVRRHIGIVFQSFNLFPHMTVERNVTLAPMKVLGLSRAEAVAQAAELLDRFGLGEKRADYPDRLSGGQQQRVAIVRALALRPRLMLLDEVTSALDPELVADVLDVIRELAEGGMTMLIATHEMGFARDIASRVCFLADGQIVEQAPPDRLFSEPSDERTRRFLRRIVDAGRL